MFRVTGTVRDGKTDANKWLRRFSEVYANWLGQEIYPGSLNVDMGALFDWQAPEIAAFRRTYSLKPFGGERDIFMIPCAIVKPGSLSCWLWTTTTAADKRTNPNIVEIIAPIPTIIPRIVRNDRTLCLAKDFIDVRKSILEFI